MIKVYKILDEQNQVVGYGYNGKMSSTYNGIVNKMSKKEQNEAISFETILNEDYKEKFEGKIKARRLGKVAGVLAATTLIGVGTSACVRNYNNKEIAENEFEGKTLDELLDLLKDENQKEAFTKIANAQNYFNNTAAPSIKINADKKAQLYLTAEEVIALYAYANADTWTNEELAKILGKEYSDAEELSNNYTQAARVMNTYYRYATEKSGLSELFEDENNKALFEEIENLLIKYNKTKENSLKEEIKNKLIEIYMSGDIDDLKTVNKESASYIATLILPSMYERGIVDKETYKSIVEINETITCNDLKEELKKVEELATSENNVLLTTIVDKMNQEYIKVESRNIDIEARESKKLTDSTENYKTTGNATRGQGTTSTTKDKITKEEAIKEFGKEEVSKAEQEADKKFEEEYAEKNEKQKAYGQGLSDGYQITYEKTYDAYINSGTTLTASSFSQSISTKVSNYTGKYKEEYKKGLTEGAARGITLGLKDAKADKKKMEEFDNKKPTQVVEEERVTEQQKEEPTKKPVVETKPEESTTEVPTTEENTKVTITDDFIIVEEVEEERVYGDEEAPVRTRK